MSSVELSCSRARVVCSRGYKLVGRGCQTQVPLDGIPSVGSVGVLDRQPTKGSTQSR
jgi:hypothetical protein